MKTTVDRTARARAETTALDLRQVATWLDTHPEMFEGFAPICTVSWAYGPPNDPGYEAAARCIREATGLPPQRWGAYLASRLVIGSVAVHVQCAAGPLIEGAQ